MLDRLKDQLLSDDRMGQALAEFRSLYEMAEDPVAFHAALTEGDIAAAAEHHLLTADELSERCGDMMAAGEALADDYGAVLEHERIDFINA